MATPRALTFAERRDFYESLANDLQDIYAKAEDDLVRLTSQVENLTEAGRKRANAIKKQVGRIRTGLDKSFQAWAVNGAEESYRLGMEISARELINQDVKASYAFTRIHQEAVTAIVADMVLQMKSEHQSIDRIFNRAIRLTQQKLIQDRLISQQVARGLIEGAERRVVSNRILDDLLKKMKGGQFIEINGKKYRPGPYARLVARTRTREATTEGSVMTMVQNGTDLAQFSYHATSCPVCRPYERKVFSISGNSKVFPPLEKRPPIHPNCGHVLVPYNEEIAKERGEYDQDVEHSNEPIRPPTRAELNQYAQRFKKKPKKPKAVPAPPKPKKAPKPKTPPKAKTLAEKFSRFEDGSKMSAELNMFSAEAFEKAPQKLQDAILATRELRGVGVSSSAYHQSGSIFTRGTGRQATFKPSTGRGDFTTWRHEYGHHLHKRNAWVKAPAGSAVARVPRKTLDEFHLIAQDYAGRLSNRTKEGKALLAEIREDFTNGTKRIRAENFKGDKSYEYARFAGARNDLEYEKARLAHVERYKTYPGDHPRAGQPLEDPVVDIQNLKTKVAVLEDEVIKKETIYKKLVEQSEEDLKLKKLGETMDEQGYLEDYFGALTNNKVGGGHSNGYYQNRRAGWYLEVKNGVGEGNVTEMLANLTEIYNDTNKTRWNYIKKHTPEIADAYLKFLDDVIKNPSI